MTQRFSFDESMLPNDSQTTSDDNVNLKKNFFDFEDDETDDLIFESEFVSQSTKDSKASKVDNEVITNTNKTLENVQDNSRQTSNFDFKFNFESVIDQMVLDFSELKYTQSIPSSPSVTFSPRLAIEYINSGDNTVNLSIFRSKEQKLELLDYALLTGNSVAITKTILFLRQTLKSSIFFFEITRRPVAADHYLIYLRNTEQIDAMLDALTMLGRNEDAAFAMYSRTVRSQSGENQLKSLQKIYSNFFTSGGSDVMQWQSYIKDHMTLLEQQLPIEADDHRRELEELNRKTSSNSASNNESSASLFVIYPRPSLFSLSLLQTLSYCCLYHYHLQDNNFASPFYLKKLFSLTEKQFLWTALTSLAKCSQWSEIDNLFEYKSWLGSRKIKNSIPTEEIVRVLFHNSAPLEMLEKYLELVDNVELRLQLAKEFLLTKFAADILIKSKDRTRLTEFRASIQTTHDVDYIQLYIDNALRSSTIKWKN